jgi:hypothetical protein
VVALELQDRWEDGCELADLSVAADNPLDLASLLDDETDEEADAAEDDPNDRIGVKLPSLLLQS